MTVKLENLQVVIFSRNRHKQLIESLDYWDKCGVQTLVLHNTQDPLDTIDIPQTTEYIVHKGTLAERCEIASRNLKFNFFIIASDDERYLPTALFKMVEELEKSPELTSVGGQAIGVMKHGLRYGTNLAYRSQIQYQNTATDFQDRFYFHYESGRNYSGAMYRVFRREEFKKFLLLISKFSDISTPYIFEVTAELFWTLIGPAKYVDEVFWVRNWVVPPIQTGDWDRKQYFYEWSQSPTHKKEFESWKLMVAEEFEPLKRNPNFFTKIALHRMKIEQNEQTRNQELRKRKKVMMKKMVRAVVSIFQSKYQTKELCLELGRHGVSVRTDELRLALNSMTS
jgi:hypothetical protein